MRPIQYLLAILVGGGVLGYARSRRSRAIDRALVLSIGMAGLILVIMPDWSIRLANLVGVQRGVDLILYLGIVGLAYLCLLLFSRLRAVDERLTRLAREISLRDARPAPPRETPPSVGARGSS